MKNIVTFINMDGYVFYLWPAFSLTILILLIMATIGLIKLKASEKALNKVSEGNNKKRKESKSETQA